VAADIIATVKGGGRGSPSAVRGWRAVAGDAWFHEGLPQVRVTGPGRRRYRMFCILERNAPGLGGPSVVLITGMDKPPGSGFSEADYARVRTLGREFPSRTRRSVAR
jgi:hypothetical protein